MGACVREPRVCVCQCVLAPWRARPPDHDRCSELHTAPHHALSTSVANQRLAVMYAHSCCGLTCAARGRQPATITTTCRWCSGKAAATTIYNTRATN
jgi:hypothetical protein